MKLGLGFKVDSPTFRMSLSFAASIWEELEVALDDAAADVGEEDGEIRIGAK